MNTPWTVRSFVPSPLVLLTRKPVTAPLSGRAVPLTIAGQRGGPNMAYHASKAFAANYLQGLSMHAQRLKLPITITDIQLGLFDKAVHLRTQLLLSPIDNVAGQILTALKKGKRRVYVTKRWRIVAWINRLLPEYIYNTRHWKPKKKGG